MLKKLTQKRNKKGFTLVELVVVIAILGILALIAVPRLGGFRNQAGVAADKATAASIGKAAELYATSENLPEAGTDSIKGKSNLSITDLSTAQLIEVGLVPQKAITTAKNFYLNYQPTKKVFYVTYSVASTNKADVLYPENFDPAN